MKCKQDFLYNRPFYVILSKNCAIFSTAEHERGGTPKRPSLCSLAAVLIAAVLVVLLILLVVLLVLLVILVVLVLLVVALIHPVAPPFTVTAYRAYFARAGRILCGGRGKTPEKIVKILLTSDMETVIIIEQNKEGFIRLTSSAQQRGQQ